jgi:hypothetical protein
VQFPGGATPVGTQVSAGPPPFCSDKNLRLRLAYLPPAITMVALGLEIGAARPIRAADHLDASLRRVTGPTRQVLYSLQGQ